MKFINLNQKDFFNPYYFKKQITQNEFDSFKKLLNIYLDDLKNSKNQNEDYLVANALASFLKALNFNTAIKHK